MRYLAAVVCALALALMTGVIQAQNVEMMKSQGFMPNTITIRATEPGTTRICAEPVGGGLVSCRQVSDFRVWALQRAAK